MIGTFCCHVFVLLGFDTRKDIHSDFVQSIGTVISRTSWSEPFCLEPLATRASDFYNIAFTIAMF